MIKRYEKLRLNYHQIVRVESLLGKSFVKNCQKDTSHDHEGIVFVVVIGYGRL